MMKFSAGFEDRQADKLKKVLVVDDEENMRHMLASLLGAKWV